MYGGVRSGGAVRCGAVRSRLRLRLRLCSRHPPPVPLLILPAPFASLFVWFAFSDDGDFLGTCGHQGSSAYDFVAVPLILQAGGSPFCFSFCFRAHGFSLYFLSSLFISRQLPDHVRSAHRLDCFGTVFAFARFETACLRLPSLLALANFSWRSLRFPFMLYLVYTEVGTYQTLFFFLHAWLVGVIL